MILGMAIPYKKEKEEVTFFEKKVTKKTLRTTALEWP